MSLTYSAPPVVMVVSTDLGCKHKLYMMKEKQYDLAGREV